MIRLGDQVQVINGPYAGELGTVTDLRVTANPNYGDQYVVTLRHGFTYAYCKESELRVQKFHIWDDDACCINCGFDGAEWSNWKHHTYEGKASSLPMPNCGEQS
jgi:hypothetical protein